MARSARTGFVLLALAIGASCDTDEPLNSGTRNADVEIIPIAAEVDLFKVWDLTEDSDGQPGPDDVNGDGIAGDVSLWCEFDAQGPVGSVPWTYSVKVRVVRAEDNQPSDLTTPQAATAEFNRGSYDTNIGANSGLNPAALPVTHVRGACSGNDAIRCNPASTSTVCQDNGAGSCQTVFGCSGDNATVCDPGNLGDTCRDRGAGFCTLDGFCSGDPGIPCEASCADLQLGSCVTVMETRIFQFASSNRRRLSAANRELLQTGPNFLFDACLGDPACTAQVDTVVGATTPELGLCPGQDLGDPAFDPGNPLDLNGDPLIFGLQLDKGDRVIIEARRSDTVPGNGQVITFHEPPGLRARLSIDGVGLQAADVQCAQAPCSLSSEEGDPSPNVAFSLTVK